MVLCFSKTMLTVVVWSLIIMMQQPIAGAEWTMVKPAETSDLSRRRLMGRAQNRHGHRLMKRVLSADNGATDGITVDPVSQQSSREETASIIRRLQFETSLDLPLDVPEDDDDTDIPVVVGKVSKTGKAGKNNGGKGKSKSPTSSPSPTLSPRPTQLPTITSSPTVSKAKKSKGQVGLAIASKAKSKGKAGLSKVPSVSPAAAGTTSAPTSSPTATFTILASKTGPGPSLVEASVDSPSAGGDNGSSEKVVAAAETQMSAAYRNSGFGLALAITLSVVITFSTASFSSA